MHYKEDQLAIHLWLQQPLGKFLIAAEKSLLAKIDLKTFGYNLLLVGEPEFIDCAKIININHKVLVHADVEVKTDLPLLCSRQDKLPIASESIDVVYLAHALEGANNPHEVLRESYRILRPEGYLVLSGFNPFSFWGIWKMFARFTGKSPWTKRFISNLKIKDWLYLLGFDIVHSQSYGHFFPINNNDILSKMRFLEKAGTKLKLPFGAANLVIACKRDLTLTPIKPTWKNEEQVLARDLAEPSI